MTADRWYPTHWDGKAIEQAREGPCRHLSIHREEIDVGFYGTVVRTSCNDCGEVIQ